MKSDILPATVEEMTRLVESLEEEAVRLRKEQAAADDWRSIYGVGDRVSGIRVVRNGETIQEWHDDRS